MQGTPSASRDPENFGLPETDGGKGTEAVDKEVRAFASAVLHARCDVGPSACRRMDR
ncbi:hypothetical protein [Streptomyces sp. NPDC049040]|uniref:hypothetical protein n=1 Tax=Streptomyces sp. NPDC049040 TaxID=3365593 RepID=UPI0037193A31